MEINEAMEKVLKEFEPSLQLLEKDRDLAVSLIMSAFTKGAFYQANKKL